MERRGGKMTIDFVSSAEHGGERFWMGHLHDEVVEPGVLARPPLLLCCNLKKDRLRRHLDRGESNTILLAKVAQRFHVRVLGVEPEVVVGNGSDTLDSETTLCAVPEQCKRGNALRGEVQIAGKEGIYQRCGPAKCAPFHLDVAQLRGSQMLFH